MFFIWKNRGVLIQNGFESFSFSRCVRLIRCWCERKTKRILLIRFNRRFYIRNFFLSINKVVIEENFIENRVRFVSSIELKFVIPVVRLKY